MDFKTAKIEIKILNLDPLYEINLLPSAVIEKTNRTESDLDLKFDTQTLT